MYREQLIEWGRDRATKNLLMNYDGIGSAKHRQIRKYWPTHREFIADLGILEEYMAGRYRKNTGDKAERSLMQVARWGRAELIAEVLRLYSAGVPVHYSAIERMNSSFHKVINREFGSHRNLIEEAGLDYAEIANPVTDSSMSYDRQLSVRYSELGHEFEMLLGNLLSDLGKAYTQYDSGVLNCEPDFIFTDDHWGDAKLSITTNIRVCRRKYLKHCSRLTIMHLIGKHSYYSELPDGTARVSVFYMIHNSSEDVREKHLPLFLDLERRYMALRGTTA